MKKYGFTLAEVLITMGIVGVIAALTIPTFVANSQNQANAAKLSSLVSIVENAFTSMIAAEGVQDLSETAFAANPTATNLGKYIKITGSDDETSKKHSHLPSGAYPKGRTASISVTRTFYTPNGASISYYQSSVSHTEAEAATYGIAITDRLGMITIDVNGNSKPNTWGRDAFYFMLGNDGKLYPAGGKVYSFLCSTISTTTWKDVSKNNNLGCNDANKGFGCTARLIENNYKVDY